MVTQQKPAMRFILLICLISVFFAACEKASDSRVDIYMLKSFTVNTNQSTPPGITTISNAVLEAAPLVSDNDIAYYTQATTTFKLKKDIKSIIKDYGADKAFAVTVNGKAVYYGLFHPAYLSSLVIGLATIDPFLYNEKELTVQFVEIEDNVDLQKLDKRNDESIITAFSSSGRLR